MKTDIKKLFVVIAGGGSSNRFGENKLLTDLNGTPVFIHSIKNFLELISESQLLLVVNENEIAKFADLIKLHLPKSKIKVIAGGKTRMHSVVNSLNVIPKIYKYVAIHDAARPLANKTLLLNCYKKALKYGAAISAKPIVETLKKGQANIVKNTISRKEIYSIETPQIFKLETLLFGYEEVLKKNIIVTDDASIYEYLKKDVFLYINKEYNIKITFPEDLILVQSIMNLNSTN